MAQESGKSNPYSTLGVVTSLSLHVLLLGFLGISCIMDKKPEDPPPMMMPVEIFEVEPIAPETAPPEPEPPKPKEPEPPKPKEPEPPKPKEPEPPKPKEPEPKKVEKPKEPTREERLAERLKNAKENTPKPPQPPKKDTRAEDVSKRLDEALKKSSNPTIKRSTANPNRLPAAQLNAYQNYLAVCLEPQMQRIWDLCGPEQLPNQPRPVLVTLMITPAGHVTAGFITTTSDNEQMNSCAKKLLEQMKSVTLQPFSKSGLPMNASLSFQVYLNYRTGNSR